MKNEKFCVAMLLLLCLRHVWIITLQNYNLSNKQKIDNLQTKVPILLFCSHRLLAVALFGCCAMVFARVYINKV